MWLSTPNTKSDGTDSAGEESIDNLASKSKLSKLAKNKYFIWHDLQISSVLNTHTVRYLLDRMAQCSMLMFCSFSRSLCRLWLVVIRTMNKTSTAERNRWRKIIQKFLISLLLIFFLILSLFFASIILLTTTS